MMKSLSLTKSIFFALLLAFSLPATTWGWGLSSDLQTVYAETRLVVPVYRFNAINYCVEVKDDPEVNQESIEFQTEIALQVWLQPLKEVGIEHVKIGKMPCASPEIDLRIRIGKLGGETKNFTAAHYDSQLDDKRYYSNVVIDTQFKHKVGQKRYNYVDLIKVIPGSISSFKDFLVDLVFKKKFTTEQLANAQKLDPTLIWHTSFPIIIHELGHAFGLCDTYKPQNDMIRKNIDCGSEYLNKSHPDSVMKLADRFSLTDDDREGILAVFRHFKGKVKSANEKGT